MSPIQLSYNREIVGKPPHGSPELKKLDYMPDVFEGELEDLARLQIEAGHVISTALLVNGRHDDNHFKSSQLIGIDFDEGPSVEELSKLLVATKYRCIVYATANSTPDSPRSRIEFQLDKPLIDGARHRAISELLRQTFISQGFKVDPVCKSPVQAFFGSKNGTFFVSKGIPLPVDSLIVRVPQKNIKEDKLRETPEITRILTQGGVNGHRNEEVVALASRLSNVLPKEDTTTIIKLSYYDPLADKTDFPWTDCVRIIDWTYDKDSTKKVLSATNAAIVKTLSGDVEKRVKAKAVPFTTLGYKNADPKWLVEGILPAEAVSLMVAPPEHFKTWFSDAIAVNVSAGQPLFGRYNVPGPQKVLMMQLEDARSTIHQRLNLIWYEMGKSYAPPVDPNVGDRDKELLCDFLAPNIDMYFSEETFQVSNQTHMDDLEEMIAENKYGLVIIDPLYAIADSSDFMASAAKYAVRFKRMRDKYGVAFMILHHTKKMGKDPVSSNGKQRRESTWGSQLINALAECTIMLRGTKNPKETLFDLHMKSQEGRDTKLLTWDISTKEDDMHFRVTEAAATKAADGSNPLQVFVEHGALTVGQYAEFTDTSPSGASRRLSKMLGAGILVRHGDLYSLPDLDETAR